jgi:hypothetical protein
MEEYEDFEDSEDFDDLEPTEEFYEGLDALIDATLPFQPWLSLNFSNPDFETFLRRVTVAA